MRDYYNDPPESYVAPEDEAIWEILESAGTDEESIKMVSAIVHGLLCEIGRLRNIGEAAYEAAPAPSLYDIPDNELPGMWEKADFEGGKPDVVRGPAPSLCTAEEAAELARQHGIHCHPDGNFILEYDELAKLINADRAKR